MLTGLVGGLPGPFRPFEPASWEEDAFWRDSGDIERWLIAAIASVFDLRGARLDS